MTNIIRLIEGVKAKRGVKSNRELAIRIGISQPSLTNIMAGLNAPSDETCVKLAEFGGMDPAVFISAAHASKASETTKKYWNKIFKAVAAAALVLIAAATVLAPFPAGSGHDPILQNEYYVKSKIWCRFVCRVYTPRYDHEFPPLRSSCYTSVRRSSFAFRETVL